MLIQFQIIFKNNTYLPWTGYIEDANLIVESWPQRSKLVELKIGAHLTFCHENSDRLPTGLRRCLHEKRATDMEISHHLQGCVDLGPSVTEK